MRADALTLYGFSTGTEKRAFDLLMSVQHVGPKLAFTILSVLAPEELVAAIANGDVERIDSVPGGDLKLVASSTAQINGPTRAATPGNRIPAGSLEEAISALVNLGMKPVEAKRTVEDVVAEDSSAAESSEVIIRRSLEYCVAKNKHRQDSTTQKAMAEIVRREFAFGVPLCSGPASLLVAGPFIFTGAAQISN